MIGNAESLLSQPFNEALQSILAWACELLPQGSTPNLNPQYRETFTNVSDCSIRFKRLISVVEGDPEASSWPLIKKIRE